jgi:uncharacterized membrane protein HdeD (DUF308 family)
MTTVPASLTPTAVDVPLRRIYLVRAAVAVVWAVAFASSSSKLDGATMALLIVYPGIDVAASLADARTHQKLGISRLQIANAALSTAAIAAIAITSTNDKSSVLRAFGAWALISGLMQLAVAISRHRRTGWQWAMLVSGVGSSGAGLTFEMTAGRSHPSLSNVAGFVGFGAFLFIVSAFLLGRSARNISA